MIADCRLKNGAERRVAIGRLNLPPGGRVCEIGCGTGANFAYRVDAVGPSGEVVGVDISPDMVAGSRGRVERVGWGNVQVLEGAAEDIDLPANSMGCCSSPCTMC